MNRNSRALRKGIWIFSIYALCTLLIPAPEAALASPVYQLSGKITDQSGNPIFESEIEVLDPNTGVIIVSDSNDPLGSYSLSVPEGTYDIRVRPPAGSNFQVSTKPEFPVFDDTILDFILVPIELVTLSGSVLDPLGNGVPDQTVAVAPVGSGSWTSTTTDLSGNYAIEVTPGDYNIKVYAGDNDPGLNIPEVYSFDNSSSSVKLSLVEDTVLDLPLPFHRVEVLVQDPVGNPISDVNIRTFGGYSSNTLGSLPYVRGRSYYSSIVTDTAGGVILWLVQNQNTAWRYTLEATPPEGSVFLPTSLTDVQVVADMSVTIILQAPVTLSGSVLDPLGNGIPDQTVAVAPVGSGSWTETTTDLSGNYVIEVTPGDYNIKVYAGGNDPGLNIPQSYSFDNSSGSVKLSLVEDTVLDLPLPFHRVEVLVQDPVGNPISDVNIRTFGGYSSNTLGPLSHVRGTSYYSSIITDTAGRVILWLVQNQNASWRYVLEATPSAGSVFLPTSLTGVQVVADMSVTIVLQAPITLSGSVLDPLGNGVPDQTVAVAPVGSGSWTETTTDLSGNYAIEVTPGDYNIKVYAGGNDPGLNIPQSYSFDNSSGSVKLSLVEDTVLDLPLPFHRVEVLVQDPVGNPISDVNIRTFGGYSSNTLGPLSHVRGTSYYSSIITDTAGRVILWLVQNQNASWRYVLEATPSVGTPFEEFVVQGISVPASQTEVIVLQFLHAPPVTIASISPAPDEGGIYPDPVTVTFYATAAVGFTIDTTYYSLDSGMLEEYTNPFIVSGEGLHEIKFWSVDNVGVYEAPNVVTFEMRSNQPPSASANGPYTGHEGSAIAFDGSGSVDPDGDPLQYCWDFDGDTVCDATELMASWVWLDDFVGEISLRVDDGQLFDQSMALVTVENVAPACGEILGPIEPIEVGVEVGLTAEFTDPGLIDTHSALWQWGDDSTSTGIVIETNGSGSVEGGHTYNSTGVYTINLAIVDDDGGSVECPVFQYLVVFDPQGGFVTGGGWIDSPKGAYAPDPLIEGRASFGFVSKYKKSAETPTGQTEFQFKLANLNFHSETYQWLVIAGSKAKYKGTGTINGEGLYGFMLTAIDGKIQGGSGTDRFRIKIWDVATDAIVYDNKMGEADDTSVATELGGGSIVIHNAK